MSKLNININRQSHELDVDPGMPLLWVLRDKLQLTGTKFGCGVAQCGSCTVHIDGIAQRSCITPISSVGDSKVVTIEGLSKNGDHPLQVAWTEHDVPQCGYCQAGQIMNAATFLKENRNPTDEEISDAMSGNLCRCSAYLRIKEAISSVAKS